MFNSVFGGEVKEGDFYKYSSFANPAIHPYEQVPTVQVIDVRGNWVVYTHVPEGEEYDEDEEPIVTHVRFFRFCFRKTKFTFDDLFKNMIPMGEA